MSFELFAVRPMTFLQEAFDKTIEGEFSPAKVTFHLILSKFAKAGIRLSKRLEKDLEKQIEENIDKPKLRLNIDDAAIFRLNPHLPKDFNFDLNLTAKDFAAYLGKARKQIAEMVPEVVSDSADRLYKTLRQDRKATLARIEFERKGFEERLQRFWRVPIETLDLFITAAGQAGADANERGRPKAVKEKDIVFEALARLHARACRTAQEVLALIKSGFADGANARWRTIHEIAVVAGFLAKHGNDSANRYLLHQHVETLRAANQYNDYNRKLGHQRVPIKDIRRLTARVDKLKQQFGKDYGTEYGWAAAALGHPKNLRFRDIERSIDLDYWRPYYKMASHSVHAGPKGVFFTLGLMDNKDETLLAGASNTGFTDPAQGTALMLLQSTTLFLVRNPTIDSLAWMYTLIRMAKDVGKAFYIKQVKQDELEMKIRARQKKKNAARPQPALANSRRRGYNSRRTKSGLE